MLGWFTSDLKKRFVFDCAPKKHVFTLMCALHVTLPLDLAKMEIEEPTFVPTCSWVQKLSFGLGHVFNDLCAAMWFSYTLFYLHVVLNVASSTAGTLLMIGTTIFNHIFFPFLIYH